MRIIRTVITVTIIAILLISTFITHAEINLTGVGATFPAPIYTKWIYTYQAITGNKINYQGIGSSVGIKQIIASTVDFGATDIPLLENKLNKENLFQFPTIIGGIVLAVNLYGLHPNELILNGQVLGDIYLGKITKWDDKNIVKLNPNLNLPKQNITVIRRADSSGTSLIFTNYLAKVNNDWKHKVGIGSIVDWPIGLGGKGNDGVAAFIQRLPGSIGYIEYAYAKQNNLVYTKLVSANGKIVIPTEQTFANAAKKVNWSKSLSQDLTNQDGEDIWPITSTTFILIHKTQKNIKKIAEILKFFDWIYNNGNSQASDLNYVSLPDSAINQIRIAWKTNIKDNYGNSLHV